MQGEYQMTGDTRAKVKLIRVMIEMQVRLLLTSPIKGGKSIMRMLVAKEYFAGQVPDTGTYSVYEYDGRYFFTIGDGSTPIDQLIEMPEHLVIEISKSKFYILKRFYEKHAVNKSRYHIEDLDKEDRVYLDLFYIR